MNLRWYSRLGGPALEAITTRSMGGEELRRVVNSRALGSLLIDYAGSEKLVSNHQ
jgi:hypothetical protein